MSSNLILSAKTIKYRSDPITLKMNFLKNLFHRKLKYKDPKEFPSSYFVGQEYVLDPERISIEIHLLFISPGEITKNVLSVNGKQIHLEQSGSIFRVAFKEDLSRVLFENIKTEHQGDRWILGYVTEVLPHVNKEILRQRYLSGHFLIRTYSPADIFQLWLVNTETKEQVQVYWPGALPSFPELVNLAPQYDRVYLRDLIDSMHSYFNSNYEECIRKAITSIETFIKYHKLEIYKQKDGKETRRLDFKKTIKKHMDILCPMMNKKAADIIWDGYTTRNSIVHDGKRLDPTDGKYMAKRLTHMVNEVYKNFGDENELKNYAFFLEMQFVMQENFLGEDGLSLKWLEHSELNRPDPRT